MFLLSQLWSHRMPSSESQVTILIIIKYVHAYLCGKNINLVLSVVSWPCSPPPQPVHMQPQDSRLANIIAPPTAASVLQHSAWTGLWAHFFVLFSDGGHTCHIHGICHIIKTMSKKWSLNRKENRENSLHLCRSQWYTSGWWFLYSVIHLKTGKRSVHQPLSLGPK